MLTKPKQNIAILIFLCLSLFTACVGNPPTPTPTPVPPTTTPLPPTPTSLPMALRINGEGILITDYDEEFKRLDAAAKALGKPSTPEELKTTLIDEFSGMELLNQAAKKGGFSITEADIATHIAQLSQSMGGDAAFNAWLQNNFYSLDSYKRYLTRDLGAAWQRDQIIKSMPATMEQVHARQIFFSREESANGYRQQVDNGTDFSMLAVAADPLTKGDLGWFPRGYLLQPEVEEAAFQLQPGQVSPVIKSAIGFHLVQVLERDPARQLDPDARLVLESKAITDWVTKAKAEAKIELLVP